MEQYELTMTEAQKERFIRSAKSELINKGWNYRRLAKECGYALPSIYQFFSDKKMKNRFLAAKIAFVLAIPEKAWK